MIEPLRLARLLSLMCSQLDQLAYILYQSAKELTFPAKIIWIFDVEGIKKLLRYQKGHICKKTKYLGRSSSKSSETSNWRTYSFALYFIQVVIVNRSSGPAGGMKKTALKSTSSSALKWVQPKGSSPKACGSKRSQVENEIQETVLDDLVFYAISHKLQPTYIDGAYIFSSLKRVHKEFSEKYTTQSVFQLLLISPQCISTLNEQIPTSQCTWNPQKVTNLCERLIKTLILLRCHFFGIFKPNSLRIIHKLPCPFCVFDHLRFFFCKQLKFRCDKFCKVRYINS